MITGYAQPAIHAAAYAAGAAAVLNKPFQMDDFRAVVRAQLATAIQENTND
jgi:CheY-like chemotaxis protein